MHSENNYQKGNTTNAHAQFMRDLFYDVQTRVLVTLYNLHHQLVFSYTHINIFVIGKRYHIC